MGIPGRLRLDRERLPDLTVIHLQSAPVAEKSLRSSPTNFPVGAMQYLGMPDDDHLLRFEDLAEQITKPILVAGLKLLLFEITSVLITSLIEKFAPLSIVRTSLPGFCSIPKGEAIITLPQRQRCSCVLPVIPPG